MMVRPVPRRRMREMVSATVTYQEVQDAHRDYRAAQDACSPWTPDPARKAEADRAYRAWVGLSRNWNAKLSGR